jgi:GNAT superfamily N-acetyltransferase
MRTMPNSGVRPARTMDAQDVGLVNERSWRVRFADILPAATLAVMHPDDLALTWAGSILNPPTPRHRLLVAVDDGVLAGYVAIGPSGDPDADPTIGELIALEVDPSQARRGHGSRLLAAAADQAGTSGFDVLVAWCVLADEPRRSFLQSAGFGPDAAYRDVCVGSDEAGDDVVVREVRLATSLAIDDHGALPDPLPTDGVGRT